MRFKPENSSLMRMKHTYHHISVNPVVEYIRCSPSDLGDDTCYYVPRKSNRVANTFAQAFFLVSNECMLDS